MEETIGYEALFPSDEWDSLDTGEWSYDDIDLDGSNSPSGVTRNGDGNAAHNQTVAPEGSSFEMPSHTVTNKQRALDDGTTALVLECELCDEIGTAETLEEAEAIARLHESFVAELMCRWEVE